MHTLLEIGIANALMAVPLALLAAIISRVCRRPAVAHALWLLVLLKLITPPLLPVSLPWPALADETREPGEISAPVESAPELAIGNPSAKSLPPTIEAPGNGPAVIVLIERAREGPGSSSPGEAPAPAAPGWGNMLQSQTVQLVGRILCPAWLATSGIWCLWLGLGTWRFHRLLRYAQRAPEGIQLQVRELAQRLGKATAPVVWLVPGAVSPMLWALGSTPRLLFPAKLLDRLDPDQRATLLLHELAHWRRRDHWVRFLEVIVLGLYWWHPVVWWARRELREAEEQCCDAWVVGTLAEAERAYATAILQTVAFFSRSGCTLPAAASGIGQVRHLRRRLTMIMQGKTPRSLSWAGFLAVLGLGLLLLPLLPVRGQPPAPGKGDATDQKIAELKRAIKVLEEQKQAQKIKGDDANKEKAAELAKVRAQADALAKQVAVKRRELEAAQAKHREALEVLARLEGKDLLWYNVVPGTEINRFSVQPKEQWLQAQEWQAYELEQKEAPAQWKAYELKHWEHAAPKNKPATDKKAAELERKLDRLLKEVDELRQELRKNQAKGGGDDKPQQH